MFASKAFTVSTTPIKIASGDWSNGVLSVVVLNDGGQTVYTGGSNVDTTNGFPIAANGVMESRIVGDDVWYAVCASGQDSTLRVQVRGAVSEDIFEIQS